MWPVYTRSRLSGIAAFDIDRLLEAWQEAVFALYVAQCKIEPGVVENMRSWPHSGLERRSVGGRAEIT